MGTDIHCYAERKEKGPGKNARWVHVPGELQDGFEPFPEEGLRPYAFLHLDRMYELFNLLGGRDSDHPIVPLRGIPKDASPEVKAEAARWSDRAHGRSWMTLAELLAFDWLQEGPRVGFVWAPSYKKWLASGKRGNPGHWDEDLSGLGKHQLVTERAMQEHIKSKKKPSRRMVCRAEWTGLRFPYLEAFWKTALHQLHRLGPPDQVRIVYYFDS